MDKINWCFNQREGIKLVEPSQNLANAYIKKAEDSLLSVEINQIKEWKITTAYYTSYFALYAILQKIGIKCEIHACTIEFAKLFLKEFFAEEELDFIEDSFKARKDSQYYVNRAISDQNYQEIINRTPKFLVRCKSILLKLDENKIIEIRKKLSISLDKKQEH